MDNQTVYRPQNVEKGQRAVLVFLIVGLVIGMLVGRGWTRAESPRSSSAVSSSSTASGFVLGQGQNPPPNIGTQDVEFRLFWEAWQLLKDKYYLSPEVQDKQMFYGAMKGLAESVGDPYTTFFEPKGAEAFQQALSGKFSGIGAEIGLRDGIITVVAPLPDTPAERAGIKAGDLIAKIDGTETTGFSVEQAVSKIRGDKGTKVVLTIVRTNDKSKTEPFDVTITRDEIQVKSVRLKWIDGQTGIAHLEVTNFNTDTVDGLNKAIDDMLAKDVKGIVLDLRNNPGGFLDTAAFMAGEWVGNKIVVKERRQGEIVEQLPGTGRNRLAGIPTVVLVNEGSASASEIVSGALQDYKAATIVGKKTFGKGSVQDYTNLKDGSAIKITIAEWLTPLERTINNTGLEPDISIERTPEDYENPSTPNSTAPSASSTAPRPDRRPGSQRPQAGNRHYHAALAAGGIIYRKRAGHVEIFFIKDPYQRWTFPKGRREAGENLTQTAIREVKEETGLEGLRVIAPVGQSKFSFRRNGVVIDRSVLFFLFEAPLTAKEKLTGEGGIWEGKWVRAHQVFDANGYRNLDRLLSKALRIISYEERKTRGFSAKNPSSFGATPQTSQQPFRSRRPRIIT